MLQEHKAFVQTSCELINGEHRKKGRSQFQRQRKTVQLTADVDNGCCILRSKTKTRVALSSSFTKKLDGFVASKLLYGMILSVIRRCQGSNAPDCFSRDTQRFATGSQDIQVRADLQKRLCKECAFSKEVLAIIQEKKNVTLPKRGLEE